MFVIILKYLVNNNACYNLLFYAMFSCNSNSALEFFCHNCFALRNARHLI